MRVCQCIRVRSMCVITFIYVHVSNMYIRVCNGERVCVGLRVYVHM